MFARVGCSQQWSMLDLADAIHPGNGSRNALITVRQHDLRRRYSKLMIQLLESLQGSHIILDVLAPQEAKVGVEGGVQIGDFSDDE